ncbi:50S ribosomal protein L15 [candidate division WOR-1 bacterium RIFOXYB2_FULL_42_35]|uniref:Large ribosomal subunit protein uL15 n=1 Tax=candidate division WOR-1 bacterium RIFOXYC2_FULL_41_25 TaxID=1802586 RepID=A0A1F4TM28_UNCSA|nr:MAG: 50S ribosomal protein L15 [candidate division WOR-1 bacterium RIFOXYA2_FULL_41_14]OGC23871.1 MAG: 50S ribosomal protein L15 [candidate division WOR-1 bacterium RIFOXYB2_FULL_42_35]OGC33746.1 MAG: 50S ribosomal protein L15 [candidate division WOR-1 bacterium RIFOXYC2_FULL_41_25]OGC42500.1 MAG: 50S ribosomal protein L15 [candidate division WOR-1 bacterium RIFOXYD2_FULL_41_8]
MLALKNPKPKKGSTKNKKRVGRGTSSGMGKTCGRGHKGQKSRSGGTKGIRFEGGQTPLYRRLPKRGFSNSLFSLKYTAVNVKDLNAYDSEVNKDTLKVCGTLKILGDGEIKKALTVTADKFSKSAKEKIEKAGGKCICILQPENKMLRSKKKKETGNRDARLA